MSFEQADMAMNEALAKSEQAPVQATQEAVPAQQVSESAPPQTQSMQVQPKIEEILDLDKHEKFRWGGREWNRDDLRKSTMLSKDYTQKTQKMAEERKWETNFSYDMAKVLRNPDLLYELRRVYPESYHKRAEEIISLYSSGNKLVDQTQGQPHQPQADVNHPLMNKVQFLESQLTELLSQNEKSETEKYMAEIDAIVSEQEKKYELADSHAVLARMQLLREQGEEPTKDLWERLYKSSHDLNAKRLDARQSKLIEQQKQASSKAQDMAPGGGIPAQAPVRLKGLKGAEEAAIAHFTRK